MIDLYIETCDRHKDFREYLGYECCEEKIRRGADKIFKYLYVPEL